MGRKPKEFQEIDEHAMDVILGTMMRDDTVSIITCVSYLDEFLRLRLMTRMKKSKVTGKLDPNRGLIGSFVAKADLLYVLGAIEKLAYQELVRLAEMRNLSAHSHMQLGFGNEEVQEACEKLKIPDRPDLFPGINKVVVSSPSAPDEIARSRFRASIIALWDQLRQGVISESGSNA